MKRAAIVIMLVFIGVVLSGVARAGMQITTAACPQNGTYQKKFTCDGDNISPAVNWTGAPQGVKSYALIMDDPDAPNMTYIHWVVFNIPASAAGLPENVKPAPEMSDGTRQGNNSAKHLGYTGPCPPTGRHRYKFKLFALDTLLDLKPGSNSRALTKAMKGHILEEAETMGFYRQ